MADTEFEELRNTFERQPPRLRITTPFYSILPSLDDLDESPSISSKSDASDHEEGNDSSITETIITENVCTESNQNKNVSFEDDEIGDGLRSRRTEPAQEFKGILQTPSSERLNLVPSVAGERRRRKLPEIPKNRKSSSVPISCGQTSLLDEARHIPYFLNGNPHRTILSLKCSYLLDEDSSPDSERFQSMGDGDSGHSTAHSPNDIKSLSPQIQSPTLQSPFPPPYGGVPFSQLEILEATHRGLHKFIPRHHDEIEVEIGDPLYVQKEADDLWCEGVNIRTGRQGIFPSAYAVDLDYSDFDPSTVQVKKERYLLGYLGSVETLAHKGTGVVCQAVRKIVGQYGQSPNGQSCILEISDQGLRMVDRSRPQDKKVKKACIDYFYSLKNVSFCAFHPKDHRYIGFITKHPTIQRFACHVFQGSESTRPVAESVGRAFQRFYQKFIETAYPIEDIYIE